MLDWSRKSLVKKFHYSNINDNRECSKTVIINGREYIKRGVSCATTAVALVYKVYDPSVKRNKIAILVGVARQNPGDVIISKEEGIEIATENAMISPVMQVVYNEEPTAQTMYFLLTSYVSGLPITMVKTAQELLAEGKNLKTYNRKNNNVDKKYLNYYKDCLNLGLIKIY